MRASIFALLLTGCVEDDLLTRPGPAPGVELSTVEAAPGCQPLEAVEVRSGHHDPTTHEILSEHAVARGANYVVLDEFTVLPAGDDTLAVTRARLFRCPIAMLCYRCPSRSYCASIRR